MAAGDEVQIRIRGRLDDRGAARFAEAYGRIEVVETVLTGVVVDQAELHGVLEQLQAMGCELLEVRRDGKRS
jgi:hypothetical protein